MSPEIRPGLSMRAKIIIAFCALSALVSLALGLTTYAILNRNLLHELQNRVRNLAQTGSMLLDRGALRRLSAATRPGLADDRVTALERSTDFRTVSDQLNRLRDTEKTLIRFVYTFVPTPDEDLALYLVDADVIEDTARGAEDISHLGSDFDVTEFPVARQALHDKKRKTSDVAMRFTDTSPLPIPKNLTSHCASSILDNRQSITLPNLQDALQVTRHANLMNA